jgi:hypothetical protein
MYGPAASIVSATNYAPYGVPFETYTTLDSALGFTGEFTDTNALVFLRARYYSPARPAAAARRRSGHGEAGLFAVAAKVYG